MIKIPARHSKQWALMALALFLFVLVAFLAFCLILGIDIVIRNLIGFAIISLVVSAAANAGGFFGAKGFFFTALALDVIGVAYMLYIAISKTAEGWSDLAGIVSFMLIAGIGIILGIIVQVILFIRSKMKKQGENQK